MRYKNLVLALNHAFNAGDLTRIDAYLTPDFTDHGHRLGADGYRAELDRVRRTLAGARSEVIGLIAEGTTVVLRARLSGLHVGTARMVGVDQVHFYEGRDDRLATHHCVGQPHRREWAV